jgi:membrane protease YdiL (CAAX protease family)
MFDFLKNNPLVLEAKKARFRPRSMLMHLILFFVVMTVTDMVAAVPVSFYAVLRVMGTLPPDLFLGNDPADAEAAIGAIEEATAMLAGDDVYLLVTLFSYLLVAFLVVIYCRFVEGRPLSSMGLTSVHRPLVHYVAGLFTGLLMLAAVFLILLATGAVSVTGGQFTLPMLLLYLLAFLVYGAAQELLLHGYLMVSFTGMMRAGSAVVFSALFFALMQVYSGGFSFLAFLNTLLFGLILGLLTFRLRSLYASMALRGAWYFAELVLFGCGEAGAAPNHRVLSATLTAGRELTHGGALGVEGGAVVTVVLLLALGVLLLLPTRAAAEDIPPKSDEEAM